jgi:glycosyltransferase involved in cell wall biosynthesis
MSPLRPRILHLLGGAGTENASIARIIARSAEQLPGYQMSAWFLGSDGPLREEMPQVVETRLFPFRADSLSSLLSLWQELRGVEADLVHFHLWSRRTLWVARSAFRGPILLHLHSHVHEADRAEARVRGTRGADAVVATSKAVARWASRPCLVVHPGVQPPGSVGKRSGTELIIGSAGRLSPMKGMLHLVRAAARLREQLPEARIEIAGEGPERLLLESEIRRLRLEGHVQLLGWLPDLYPVLATWSIYVQPSVIEPFGMTAVEAMHAGLPVVATRGAGLEEIVLDGDTGILVEAGNPEAIAAAVLRLARDPALRSAMGESGRRRAQEEFSPQRMAAAISRIYNELLRRGFDSTRPG